MNHLEFQPAEPPKYRLERLPEDSQEFGMVTQLLALSLPSAQVAHVLKVHNPKLKQNFEQKRVEICQKHGEDFEVMYLFHGTRSSCPSQICSSDNGFDLAFARSASMWGKGLYFAERADYSHAYSHMCPCGLNSIFVASVMLGKVVHQISNTTLCQPPQILRNQQPTGILYDSVCGFTSGSPIYVLYEHHRAYPEYIISYHISSEYGR